MKKIVLSLAGVLAATAFAPEASAVPSFARQTGMACNSCHFQTYPALTSFGRAFKQGGYTMIGAQAKVEGDHGLSIPATLNASVYGQMRYSKTNGNSFAAGSRITANEGRFDIPDEFALFLSGRVSENIGVHTELGMTPATQLANLKMPFIFDAGSVKLAAIPFTTNGLGPAAAFDLFGTGSNAAGRVTENGNSYSAAMYMGTGVATASGLALVASNDQFHIDLTPYNSGAPNAQTTKFGATYLRAGWTPSYNNWDLGLGLQHFSGKPNKGLRPAVAAVGWVGDLSESRLTVIDGQAQGEVAGMPLGIYGSYGTAPASSVGALAGTAGFNNLNPSQTNRRTSFGLLGDLWVMPGTLGLQFGFMRAKTGFANANTLAQENDNSYTIGARYKIRQNVKLGFAYSKFSGSAYDIGGSGGGLAAQIAGAPLAAAGVAGAVAGGANNGGNSRLTMVLSAGF